VIGEFPEDVFRKVELMEIRGTSPFSLLNSIVTKFVEAVEVHKEDPEENDIVTFLNDPVFSKADLRSEVDALKAIKEVEFNRNVISKVPFVASQ